LETLQKPHLKSLLQLLIIADIIQQLKNYREYIQVTVAENEYKPYTHLIPLENFPNYETLIKNLLI